MEVWQGQGIFLKSWKPIFTLSISKWKGIERPDVRFLHDGAPSHTRKLTKQQLKDHKISVFPHPPSSPDVNPIELVWHRLKKIIQALPHPSATIPKLIKAVHKAWDALEIPILTSTLISWLTESRLFWRPMRVIPDFDYIFVHSLYACVIIITVYIIIHLFQVGGDSNTELSNLQMLWAEFKCDICEIARKHCKETRGSSTKYLKDLEWEMITISNNTDLDISVADDSLLCQAWR